MAYHASPSFGIVEGPQTTKVAFDKSTTDDLFEFFSCPQDTSILSDLSLPISESFDFLVKTSMESSSVLCRAFDPSPFSDERPGLGDDILATLRMMLRRPKDVEGEDESLKSSATNKTQSTALTSAVSSRLQSASSVSSSEPTETFPRSIPPKGSIAPSSILTFPRHLKAALVTDQYDPSNTRPELESMLKGRPKFKIAPFEPKSFTSHTSRKAHSPEKKTFFVSKNNSTRICQETSDRPSHSFPLVNSPANSPSKEISERKESRLENDAASSWTRDPRPLRPEAWAESPASQFRVRGPKYFENGVKVASEPCVMQLYCVDMIKVAEPYWTTGVTGHPRERIQLALKKEKMTGVPQLPKFVFCVNLLLPAGGCYYHLACYFGTDRISELRDQSTPFGRLAERFFFGSDDEYRNRILKLIPNIAEGNFMVRSAVGGKPTLIGRKLKQHSFFQGGGDNHPHRCLEIMIDVSSNAVANRVTKLVLGYAKTLVVDLVFLLEAEDRETLPERLLGGVRISNIDFAASDGERPVVNATNSSPSNRC